MAKLDTPNVVVDPLNRAAISLFFVFIASVCLRWQVTFQHINVLCKEEIRLLPLIFLSLFHKVSESFKNLFIFWLDFDQ